MNLPRVRGSEKSREEWQGWVQTEELDLGELEGWRKKSEEKKEKCTVSENPVHVEARAIAEVEFNHMIEVQVESTRNQVRKRPSNQVSYSNKN